MNVPRSLGSEMRPGSTRIAEPTHRRIAVSNPGGLQMDFEHSERARLVMEQVERFVRERVVPNEAPAPETQPE